MSTFLPLLLPRQIYDAMLQHALSDEPNECCGLLSGRTSTNRICVQTRWPLLNALSSPAAYSVDSRLLVNAFKAMRTTSEDLVAIYHSHPTSEAIPSRFDHADWNYGPHIACVIISLAGKSPTLRAWSLDQNRHLEWNWQLLDDSQRIEDLDA